MANRSAQMHLSTGQVSEMKRALARASAASPTAYEAEVRFWARRLGIRTDTVKEIQRRGRSERTR